jgi:pimeloyl-ACP methyl ester carboxylesterase
MRSRIWLTVREVTERFGPVAWPTLVLLTGMDGTGLLFQPFVEALGDVGQVEVRTIAYPAREPLDVAALTEVACAALPSGPLVILGESFSGPIAVALAARCADRVQGLILCCSFVRNPRPRWSWLMPLLRRLVVGQAAAPRCKRRNLRGTACAVAGLPRAGRHGRSSLHARAQCMSVKAAARVAASALPPPRGYPARSLPAASPGASGASARSTDRAASRGASSP